MDHAFLPTALGRCGLAWTDAGIAGFALPPVTDDYFGARGEDCTGVLPAEIAALSERVLRHLAGESQDFGDVRFDYARVTAFQREVYVAALSVPAGVTRTYGWLAERMGRPAAARALGGALGLNPWPLLVPCHRFIGANGKMTGFSAPGGLAMKRRLLAMEGAELLAEE